MRDTQSRRPIPASDRSPSRDTVDDDIDDDSPGTTAEKLLRELDAMSIELEAKQERAHSRGESLAAAANSSSTNRQTTRDNEPDRTLGSDRSTLCTETPRGAVETRAGKQTDRAESGTIPREHPEPPETENGHADGEPGRLPDHLKRSGPSDSTAAASEALRQHFGR